MAVQVCLPLPSAVLQRTQADHRGLGSGGTAAQCPPPSRLAAEDAPEVRRRTLGSQSTDRPVRRQHGTATLELPRSRRLLATRTGSPTVATGVSGKTVMSFTGSGSYTP